MKNWGKTSNRDFERIAEIIRGEELDVVAFQEILSEGDGVKQLVEKNLYGWECRWERPKESSDRVKLQEMIQEDKRGEGYAYIWNKKKFQLTHTQKNGGKYNFEPRIINKLSNDVRSDCSIFARTPYYIRLQPRYGGFFDLRLLNIHIYHGKTGNLTDIEKRKIEYQILTQEIYPQISQHRYGDFRPAYTVAMGDYNLNILRPEQSANIQEIIDVPEYGAVITSQHQLSTLKSSEHVGEGEKNGGPALSSKVGVNNYDHFSYGSKVFSDVSCYVVEAVYKYCGDDLEYYRKNISDHLPIVMEIKL